MSSRAEIAAATVNVEIPNCPDADGVLRGTARISSTAPKIATPARRGAENNLIVEAAITAYIDDSAELTHFDLSGTVTEGGANAASATFSVEESKIGASSGSGGAAATKDLQGRTMISVSPQTDPKTSERLDQSTRNAVKAVFEQTAAKLRAAREQWRGGACVEVKLTAPKTRLSAGEKVVVTAESLHKPEKTVFPAKLIKKEASASASPDEQRGTPQARFTLTAPETGKKALIVVESVSKRGIGSGKLEFEENAVVARRPPVKRTSPPPSAPPKRARQCGAWSGKITLVRRMRREQSKPASGSKVKDVNIREQTINLEYNLPGIQDPSGGFTNGYFADTTLSYRDSEFRDELYKAMKMSCERNSPIITSDQSIKFESILPASGSARTTVYVTVGDKGILTLSSPRLEGYRTITRTYDSACPSYNKINSGVDRSERATEVSAPGYEIVFELDANNHHTRLSGTKTFQESDGGEVVVTWNLTRECK